MYLKLVSVRFPELARIAKIIAITVVLFELAGIWNELHKMRGEQVKNALYSSPKAFRPDLPDATRRRLEGTSHVDGAVEVEGEVRVQEPLEVEVDR